MSYVPIEVWVPDHAETGAVVEAVQLKACGTCYSLVPHQLMDAHAANQHPEAPPAEPANPIAEPPPVAGQH
jgi:hypothetical protein